MPRYATPLMLLLASCATAPSSMVPRENTRDAVVAYVNRAAALVAKDGPACDVLKSAEWMSGDWYVFVVGPDLRNVCHPNAELVGKLSTDIVDTTGKHVGEALVAAANSGIGHGWVDYVWPRPGQTTPVPKSAYVVRVIGPDDKQYIVGSGGYELR